MSNSELNPSTGNVWSYCQSKYLYVEAMERFPVHIVCLSWSSWGLYSDVCAVYSTQDIGKT